MKEFDITLKVRVEAHSLAVAKTHANSIVDDLKKCGQEYVDRPINHVRWNRISPVFTGQIDNLDRGLSLIHREDCPGCVNCGPPIVMKAEEGRDGAGI